MDKAFARNDEPPLMRYFCRYIIKSGDIAGDYLSNIPSPLVDASTSWPFSYTSLIVRPSSFSISKAGAFSAICSSSSVCFVLSRLNSGIGCLTFSNALTLSAIWHDYITVRVCEYKFRFFV